MASNHCAGPELCCPAQLTDTLSASTRVALGLVVVGLYNVNEKASTWDADYYLYEKWKPMHGFSPQTEVVNEVVRQSEQFDTVSLSHGECTRTRRIYSTLHNDYNLRRFPFDRQKLQIVFSDNDYVDPGVDYYEQRFRRRTLDNLRRRAGALGFKLVETAPVAEGVS